MLSDEDKKIWEKVIAGVLPLFGKPRTPEFAPQASSRTVRDVRFRPVLDLHGYTVADAHTLFTQLIQDATHLQKRKLTVITGRSGQIRTEFPMWVENHPEWSCEPLNTGSFRLKRKKY